MSRLAGTFLLSGWATFVLAGCTDDIAPSWPPEAKLEIAEEGQELTVSWPKARDNRGVIQYRISRQGLTYVRSADWLEPTDSWVDDGHENVLVQAGVLRYSFPGLNPATRYRFDVYAVDRSGNWSRPLRTHHMLKGAAPDSP